MVTPAHWSGLLPKDAVRAAARLLTDAGCEDAALDAAWLCRMVIGQDPRLSDTPLTPEQAQAFGRLAERRAKREPLQYLAGSWQFFGSELQVGPGVLIPRGDTEWVCEKAASFLRQSRNRRAVDLCSGSGCIAVGLAELVPGAQITAVELSEQAFWYCNQNVQAFPGITAVQADALQYPGTLAPGSVDVFVSNPPYLTRDEMQQLQPEVRFEPAMALYGGEDGLDFYRALVPACYPALAKGGALVFEVGWQQADAVEALLKEGGYSSVGSCCDGAGIRRGVYGVKPA